jgi:hypothetical protein
MLASVKRAHVVSIAIFFIFENYDIVEQNVTIFLFLEYREKRVEVEKIVKKKSRATFDRIAILLFM